MATFKSKLNIGDLVSYFKPNEEGINVEHFGRIVEVSFAGAPSPLYYVSSGGAIEKVEENAINPNKKERKQRSKEEDNTTN